MSKLFVKKKKMNRGLAMNPKENRLESAKIKLTLLVASLLICGCATIETKKNCVERNSVDMGLHRGITPPYCENDCDVYKRYCTEDGRECYKDSYCWTWCSVYPVCEPRK